MELPNYYAVIPANVRYDTYLQPNAKLLYGEISALSNKSGYCFASNDYFAKLYKVNTSVISLWISLLNKAKYIDNKIIYKTGTKQIIGRHLYITNLNSQEDIDANVETNSPNYYSIIPANIRYDPKLQPNAKLLYGELTALSNKYGYCNATNEYFAKLFGSSKRTIINWLNSLAQNNYIKTNVIQSPNSKQVIERKIFITTKLPSEKIQNRGSEKIQNRGSEKIQKDNNTRFNTTSINNLVGEPDPAPKNKYEEIIVYLNKTLQTKYKTTSKESKKIIDKKLNEGFTVGNFKDVIDKKYKEWSKTPMAKYLRPKTLFGDNFESYLNEIVVEKPVPKNKFQNFEARKWDFDEIERLAMEWDD